MNNEPLQSQEEMAFTAPTQLADDLAARLQKDGWDAEPRASEIVDAKNDPSSIPAGHIALKGDFEEPK